jgi:hypothetical protein
MWQHCGYRVPPFRIVRRAAYRSAREVLDGTSQKLGEPMAIFNGPLHPLSDHQLSQSVLGLMETERL